MAIKISTEILGTHKDWRISNAALKNLRRFEEETAELYDYLNQWDDDNDAGGRWVNQVEGKIFVVAENKGHRNLTLAMGRVGAEDYSDYDISVFVKWED